LYATAREAATEKAFTGKYWNQDVKEPIIARYAATGYSEATRNLPATVDWPSFFEPSRKNSVLYREDNSAGMHRTEVLCARCDSHLGHIFETACHQHIKDIA